MAAGAAGIRLDDALRGYLTEQGSKRMTKADLWMLVMAALRLRLTAYSLTSLPGISPHVHDGQSHAPLEHQSAALAAFYNGLANLVARPGRDSPLPVLASPPPAAGFLPAAGRGRGDGELAGYQPDALWVGHHLSHLAAHSLDLAEPADRLARIRRRPWWR